MVLLLSNRKNKCENEIIEILQKYGAQYISDKYVSNDKGDFTILVVVVGGASLWKMQEPKPITIIKLINNPEHFFIVIG